MKQKEWTVMIYMAGDNNLAVDMAYAMEQIKGVAGEGAESPNLFVYYDGNSPSIPTLYCDFSEPRNPKYVRAMTVPDKLITVPAKQNENAADKRSVINFVNWCVNGSSLFRVGDIKDPAGLAVKLRDARDPLSKYLREQFSPDMQRQLEQHDGSSPPSEPFQSDLVVELNQLLKSPRLFDEERFAQITLMEETRKLIEQKPRGRRLSRLNRLLLEKAYPLEIAKSQIGRRARKYAMIFSGHTLGFQDIGLFRDEGSGKAMKMNDLFFLLQRLTNTEKELIWINKGFGLRGEERERETTVLLGQKLDILGFDSCVMGMLEVGYQFCTEAKTMIASEGSVPNAGWTYAKILGCLARDNGSDVCAEKIAEHFVQDFVRSQDAFTVGGVSVDMAAWDLRKLTDLAKAFDEMSEALIACFGDERSRIYRQMERVVLQVHWKCQSYMYDQNVDLGDFCELLDRECELVAEELGGDDDTAVLRTLQQKCRKVLAELKNAVILSGFSGGGYQYSNGISVFFPWSREGYEVSQKNYESLWFAKDAASRRFSWMGFLKKYLYEVALRTFEPPAPEAIPGSKYRYFSGIRFDEDLELSPFGGREIETKIAGKEGSKLAGKEGSKLAGKEGSKLAGKEGSKLAGKEGSKLAGKEGSKLAGKEGTKLAGKEGSKLAGGGSNAFFENLQLFKNVESRWNISGFTKKPGESAPE